MNISKLNAPSHRTLPQVYDDSMSYYETVLAVITKVNEIVGEVNEYFSQDIQSHVETILNAWQEGGTLDDVINMVLFDTKADKSEVAALSGSIANMEKLSDPSKLDVTHLASTGRHRPILLKTPTYDGSGHTVHPDVLYIPSGFGSRKWRYWMAHTPMPKRDDRFENPSILASHDGIKWEEVGTNPVVPAPAGANDHNSDVDLVYFNNQIWMYYRETRRVEPRQNRVYLTKTNDGVDWTAPTQVLYGTNDPAEFMSPTVVHDGSTFHMWTVDGSNNLVKRTSTGGTSWSSATGCTVIGLPHDEEVWHVNVLQANGRFEMALCSGLTVDGVFKNNLWYAYSDDGLLWRVGNKMMNRLYDFEFEKHYHGALRQTDNANVYQLWYSALDKDKKTYRIAYLTLVKNGDKLEPMTSSGQTWMTLHGINAPMMSTGNLATQELTVQGEDVGKFFRTPERVDLIARNEWVELMHMTVCKNGFGEVRLEGRLRPKTGVTPPDGEVIFYLDKEFRPRQDQIFRTANGGDVFIDNLGNVRIYRYSGTYVALDGITFLHGDPIENI